MIKSDQLYWSGESYWKLPLNIGNSPKRTQMKFFTIMQLQQILGLRKSLVLLSTSVLLGFFLVFHTAFCKREKFRWTFEKMLYSFLKYSKAAWKYRMEHTDSHSTVGSAHKKKFKASQSLIRLVGPLCFLFVRSHHYDDGQYGPSGTATRLCCVLKNNNFKIFQVWHKVFCFGRACKTLLEKVSKETKIEYHHK